MLHFKLERLHFPPLLSSGRCMQTALRAALGELTQGVSTGIVLLSANHCPTCSCQGPSINLSCPACADCVCNGRVLQADLNNGGEWIYIWTLVSVFLAGFGLGALVLILAWNRLRFGLDGPPYAIRGLGAIISART